MQDWFQSALSPQPFSAAHTGCPRNVVGRHGFTGCHVDQDLLKLRFIGQIYQSFTLCFPRAEVPLVIRVQYDRSAHHIRGQIDLSAKRDGIVVADILNNYHAGWKKRDVLDHQIFCGGVAYPSSR